MNLTISKNQAKQGLRLFLLLSLVAFILIFYTTGTGETIPALARFRPAYFLVAMCLVACDFCLGAGRIYIFTRKICTLPEARAFLESFKANLATLFMAAATPFATGGGIAQIYILYRAGVAVPAAAAAGILNFIATLSFILISGPLALGWLRTHHSGVQIQYVLRFSTVVFYLVTLLFILFLFKPGWIGNGLALGFRGLGRVWKQQKRFATWSDTVQSFIEKYRSNTVTFWKQEKPTLILNFLLTALLFSNKCLMAFVIVKGMGFHPDFITVFAIQILLLFIVYFSPTPGASLLAEAGAAVLMARVLPRHMLPVFALLWRFFLTYFGVLFGGILLMRSIGEHRDQETNEKEDIRRDVR